MKSVLIIGATSVIATACARSWSAEGVKFFLVARDSLKLRQVADDLVARGASEVHTHVLDLNHIEGHNAMFEQCFARLKVVDIALLAHGTMSDQGLCRRVVEPALREFETNASSVVALLTVLFQRLSRGGTIAVISSVAGDRGRASNYVYGAAKAAVSTYCEGLRAHLYTQGIHVLTIKPGPVDTPMTAGANLPRFIIASPERVAGDISKAIEQRTSTLYTPWFWRPIMAVIRALPASVLRRLPL